MQNVLVLGAGNIGSLISLLLLNSNRYEVFLADQNKHALELPYQHEHLHTQQLDVSDPNKLFAYIQKNQIIAVIASLPYFMNVAVAKVASEANVHYFDLTEDEEVANTITAIAKGHEKAFVPRCGVAPGLVNIAGHELIGRFESVESAKLRVGCLPQSATNDLKYALTWSTDGLINEYGNLCHGLVNAEIAAMQPLQGLEKLEIDGVQYEAFNTSGGVGSLLNTHEGKVKSLTYKTVRYPGHRDKIRFLMEDLKLNDHRDILKTILERALPRTQQDFMIMFVEVTGMKNGALFEDTYVKKLMPKEINGVTWSSIQLGTASSICAVFDMVLTNPDDYHGLVRQEDFTLNEFLTNLFGEIFQ